MKFLINSIDIEKIEELIEYLPIAGVTSNPSIVKKIYPKDFFSHMREIKDIIGIDRDLFIQVIGTRAEEYIDQARTVVKNIDEDCIIKVPASFEGIKAIRILSNEDYRVAATAVLEPLQAYMALEAGADYIAPYVNRIQNFGGNPFDLIYNLHNKIKENEYPSRIIGASFKNLAQITKALDSGADMVTATPELLKRTFTNQNITEAIDTFNSDWYEMYRHYSI